MQMRGIIAVQLVQVKGIADQQKAGKEDSIKQFSTKLHLTISLMWKGR